MDTKGIKKTARPNSLPRTGGGVVLVASLLKKQKMIEQSSFRPSRVPGKIAGSKEKTQQIVSVVRIHKADADLNGVNGKGAHKIIEMNENDDQNTSEDREKKTFDYSEVVTESNSDFVEREKKANAVMMNTIKSLGRARTFKHVENALTKSTLHRLGAIYESDSWPLRIILGLCFLSSMSYCVYQIITTILTFASYDSLTSSSVYHEIPAEFPVVQFCNLNQFDENYDADIIGPIINDGTVNITEFPTVAGYVNDVNEYFRAQLIKMAILGQLVPINMVIDITQMLVSCRFQDNDCSMNDFFQYYDYYYGVCYRFNQGRDINGLVNNVTKVGQVGVKYGLQLELYAGYAKGQESYITNKGFRILVFNKSDVNQIAQEVGIDVATGLCSNIAVRRTVSTLLGAPFSICLPTEISQINWTQNSVLQFMFNNYIDGSYYAFYPNPATSFVGENWNWTVTYSQLFCLKMCFQRYLFAECGCYDITIPFTPKHKLNYTNNACISRSQLKCKSAKEYLFFSVHELFGECYQSCPIECTQYKYDLSMSTSNYPTEWYAAVLANSPGFNTLVNRYFSDYAKQNVTYIGNFSELQKAIAKVNVYYDDLSFNQVDERPAMTFDTFLGTVGGSLALFLGASLMSLTEIFEFAYLLLHSELNKWFTTSKVANRMDKSISRKRSINF